MQIKNRRHVLNPPCRVFFDEVLTSDFWVQEEGITYPVTPTGAPCSRLFGVGELQEIERRGKISRLTLNDLTASFTVYTNKSIREEDITANAGEKKASIAFLGTVHVRESTEKKRRVIILLAEEIGAVEERVRNDWILTTAKRTMERIEILRVILTSPEKKRVGLSANANLQDVVDHYALDNEKLDAFANTAIKTVLKLYQNYHTKTKEAILGHIKKAGKNGIAREKVVSTLKNKGLLDKWVEEVIDESIREGQCYETESGVLTC